METGTWFRLRKDNVMPIDHCFAGETPVAQELGLVSTLFFLKPAMQWPTGIWP